MWWPTVGLATALVMTCSASMVAQGQANSRSSSNAVPRTAWGAPDLQGIWNFSTPTPLERPAALGDKAFYTDAEMKAFETQAAPLTAGAGADRDQRSANKEIDVALAYNEAWSERGMPLKRTSLITDPADGRIPYRPEARQRAQAAPSQAEQGRRRADSWLDRSLWERCISRSGIPRIPGTYNNNVQIIQNKDVVVLHYEMIHENRIIPLDGRPHIGAALQQWLGNSRGRWEGDTLVIESRNFSARTPLAGSTTGLTLTERITRTDSDLIDYTFTVDDSSTFTRPWSAQLPFRRIPGLVFEYACHEGNYGLANLLSGARAEEKNEGKD